VAIRGGEDVRMAVDDVGTGVGYVTSSLRASRFRFGGRGRVGDEENGSKAGSRDAVGRLLPASGDPSVAWCIEIGAIVLLRRLKSPTRTTWFALFRTMTEESRTTRAVTRQDTSYSKPAFNGFQTVMINRFEVVKNGW
jgi:hypothetical protein